MGQYTKVQYNTHLMGEQSNNHLTVDGYNPVLRKVSLKPSSAKPCRERPLGEKNGNSIHMRHQCVL